MLVMTFILDMWEKVGKSSHVPLVVVGMAFMLCLVAAVLAYRKNYRKVHQKAQDALDAAVGRITLAQAVHAAIRVWGLPEEESRDQVLVSPTKVRMWFHLKLSNGAPYAVATEKMHIRVKLEPPVGSGEPISLKDNDDFPTKVLQAGEEKQPEVSVETTEAAALHCFRDNKLPPVLRATISCTVFVRIHGEPEQEEIVSKEVLWLPVERRLAA